MWRTDSLWFEVAILMSLIVVGNILFGHFEEHKPKWRRLLKVALSLAMMLGISVTAGRAWAFAFLLIPLVGASVVHLWWLPKHGISGWTGEPKDKYLALVSRKRGARTGV